jgi:hypothetical protein
MRPRPGRCSGAASAATSTWTPTSRWPRPCRAGAAIAGQYVILCKPALLWALRGRAPLVTRPCIAATSPRRRSRPCLSVAPRGLAGGGPEGDGAARVLCDVSSDIHAE